MHAKVTEGFISPAYYAQFFTDYASEQCLKSYTY